jgi:hypothetical protein
MEQNRIEFPASSSSRTRQLSAAAALAALAITVGAAGCKLRVEKGANGEDKNVQVQTPFGGLRVDTDQTTAADLGLPVYPGAELIKDDDSHKSADVRMGFGEWQLRVRAVTYGTPDNQEQVQAFYKKALGRYGEVLTCEGNQALGSPSETTEGLTCNDSKRVQADAGDFHTGAGSLELKAGSEHHQHIVGFESPAHGQTRFALVALDLPNIDKDSGKSD